MKQNKEEVLGRCYEIFAGVAQRMLSEARNAVHLYITENMPNAVVIDEKPMHLGKYSALVICEDGEKREVVCTHRTKKIEVMVEYYFTDDIISERNRENEEFEETDEASDYRTYRNCAASTVKVCGYKRAGV